jgi:diamine N-acetyltransferase
MGAKVELRELTRDNWEQCIALEPTDEQRTWVDPNVWSIAESRFYPSMLPLAIYAGDEMVGFVMYAQTPDPRDGNFWVHRLMIDRRHQRHGYGRAAMGEVLRRLRADPACRTIWIGYLPDNDAARQFYASLGFEEQGEAPWGGDWVARLVVGD